MIELPLGVAVALAMPRRGAAAAACLVLIALPLLIPWNVVGSMWNIFALPEIGLMGRAINALGIEYNFTRDPWAAWFAVLLMDVWHWTSLVALLAYAGLRAIPPQYYQAAKIDGASRLAILRRIELPKLRRVLTIAALLRFMDSFMIYTEPFVLTGGGPGNSTTFLSIDLVKIALGQFDLGPAAAMSLIYFSRRAARVLGFLRARRARRRGAMSNARIGAAAVTVLYIAFLLTPIYWLVNMSFKTTNEILGVFSLWPREFTFANYGKIFSDPGVARRLFQLARVCAHQHRVVGGDCAAGRLTRFRAIAFWATSICFFGC